MKKNLPKSKSKNTLRKESIAKKVFRKKKHSKEKPIFAKSVHDNEFDKEEDVSFVTESTRQNNLLKNMKLMRKIINSSDTQDQNIYKEKIKHLEEENQVLRDKLIEMERNAQMAESQLDLQLQLQNQSIPRSTDLDNAEFLLQEQKLISQQQQQDLLKQKLQLQEYNQKIEQENLFLKSQNESFKNENKILLNQNFQFKDDLRKLKNQQEKDLRNSQVSKSKHKVSQNEKLKEQNLKLENQLNQIQDKYHELVKNSKNVDSQLVFFSNALNSLLNTHFEYKLVTPPVRETYKKLKIFGEQILKIQDQISQKNQNFIISNSYLIFQNKSTYPNNLILNNNIINKDLPKLTLDNVSQFFKQNDFLGQQTLSPTKQTPINDKQSKLNIQNLSSRVKRIEEYLELNTDYKKKASFQNIFNEKFNQIYLK